MYNTFEANNIDTVVKRQVNEGINQARFRNNQQSKFAAELKKFHDQISQRRSRIQRIMAGDFFKKDTMNHQLEKLYEKREKVRMNRIGRQKEWVKDKEHLVTDKEFREQAK